MTTHRMKGTPTHTSWRKMRERCLNPRATQWQWYGGAGVTICERWNTFENFLADMGERPAGKTIDRIDGTKGYEPGNCQWATHTQQTRNQRATIRVELDGVTLPLREVCEQRGLNFNTVYTRMTKLGRSFEEAIASRHLRETKSPEALREYVMHRQAGKSHKQIAAIMGVSESGLEKWSKDARALGHEWPSSQSKRWAA